MGDDKSSSSSLWPGGVAFDCALTDKRQLAKQFYFPSVPHFEAMVVMEEISCTGPEVVTAMAEATCSITMLPIGSMPHVQSTVGTRMHMLQDLD